MIRSKLIVGFATTIVCVSAANAHHKAGHGGGNNGNSAVIGYVIDPASCAVAVNSTKDISNITIQDADGNEVIKFDDLSGNTFDLGAYTALLTEGTIHVKSGNNGSRGLGPDIGDVFRDELLDCLRPECPLETEIIDALNSGYRLGTNEQLFCSLFSNSIPADFITLFEDRNGVGSITSQFSGELGIIFIDSNASPRCVSVAPLPFQSGFFATACPSGVSQGRLDSDEARACAVTMGCSNFEIVE